jgi:glucokinase
MKTLLAADIGGTKSELALFDLYGETFEPMARAIYPCDSSDGIEEILLSFLSQAEVWPDFACLDVAGVVAGGEAKMTNRSWRMNEEAMAKAISVAGVKLINDMTALCAVIPALDTTDVLLLQEGLEQKNGTKAVIAPGTGLGQGYLIEDETLFLPRGSEGGHADFAPADDEQLELLQWFWPKKQPVSFEMFCSGLGIPTLYDFCRQRHGMVEKETIRQRLGSEGDPTKVIVEGATAESPCPVCQKTMELFLSILGSEAGNLALKLYATGGLYLGGGILPRLVGKISFLGCVEAFRKKAKMEELMARIPVKLIRKRDAVLCGAARYGRKFFQAVHF